MNPRNKIVALLSLLAVIIIFTWSCKDDEFVPLKIDTVSPAEVLIGDTITLEGAGFSPDFATNEVYFSGIENFVAPVKGTTSNRLVVPVPDGATTGSVRVNILDEEIFDSPSLTIRTPIFESITPNSGYVGDTIVIIGENFRNDGDRNHVKFTEAQGYTNVFGKVISSSHTELHVIVPEGAKSGTISVLGFQGPKFNFKVGRITGISPTKGVAGDTLTISGIGFIPDQTSIYFNQGVTAVTSWEGFTNTSREMRAIVPSAALNGKIRMDVIIGQKTYSLLSDSIFRILPSIEGLSSPSGPPGYPLTINGSGFAPKHTNVVSVTINNVPATIKNFDTEIIVITVPADATSGPVKVTVNGNEATGPEFQVSAAGTPVLESLSKNEGRVGDEITIYGLYFSPDVNRNEVKFGSIKATIKEASSTALKVTVPDGAVTGNISVSSLGIQAANELPFTVKIPVNITITDINPKTILQGDKITITGTNFSTQGDIAIFIIRNFPGTPSYYEIHQSLTTVESATKITSTIDYAFDPGNPSTRIIYPPGNYYVSIRYKRSSEDLSNKVSITIQGPKPVIQSITPSEHYPGEIVTITGENFDGTDINNVVKFNNNPVEIVKPDDGDPKTIKVVVPAVTKGTYNVTVTTGPNTSENFPFKVLEKVATTVDPKPVYYLGADGSTITLNKITKDSQTPTLIFSTSGTDGITSMLVDLKADVASSKIYMSQFSFDDKNQDGIFSMALNGTSKKRIVATKPPDPDIPTPGDGQYIRDFALDQAASQLYWSFSGEDFHKILTSKTNNNPIEEPDLIKQFNLSKFYFLNGLTYSNEKIFYTRWIDDGIDNTCEIFSIDPLTKQETAIFTKDDHIGIVYDLKIDEANGKMYMLIEDTYGDYSRKILKANLNGQNLETLLQFEIGDNSEQVLGISLDLEKGHIYWLQDKGGNQTIQMARMDGADIGPGGKRQLAYNIPNLNLAGSGAGSIAVEAPGGGAGARGSMNLQLKYSVKKRK